MLSCPLNLENYPLITLAHGGGGRQSQRLIKELFLEAFDSGADASKLHDGAIFSGSDGELAFTTDSFVVSPRFFPGGDIGSLAVHGTVNDLAMCGAKPRVLSASFILEEGLATEELWRIASSMGRAAREVGVKVVTGDTKVVERGKGDGVYINTSGIGTVAPGVCISPLNTRPGDQIIINGPVAQHGIAVMSKRRGLEFDNPPVSDSAALHDLVAGALAVAGRGIRVLRDPTRGGVATALNEVAQSAQVGVVVDEARVRVSDAVKGACEIFGLDPLYVANEGKCLVWVEPGLAPRVLEAMRAHPLGRESDVIGEVVADHPGKVWARSAIGSTRFLDLLSGEQLPRIC